MSEQDKKVEDAKEQVEEMLKDPKKKGILKGIVDSIAKDAKQLSEAMGSSDFAIKDFMKSRTAWIVIAVIGMGGFSGWYIANQNTLVGPTVQKPPAMEELEKDWKDSFEKKVPSTPENRIEEPDLPPQDLPNPPSIDPQYVPEEFEDTVNQKAIWCQKVLRRFDSYWIDRVGGQLRDKVLEREARNCKKYLNEIGASYLYSK